MLCTPSSCHKTDAHSQRQKQFFSLPLMQNTCTEWQQLTHLQNLFLFHPDPVSFSPPVAGKKAVE